MTAHLTNEEMERREQALVHPAFREVWLLEAHAALRAEREENERLRAELAEERAVCLCGCAADEHESYGEDGESCGVDAHECIRVAPAVRDAFAALAREAEHFDQEWRAAEDRAVAAVSAHLTEQDMKRREGEALSAATWHWLREAHAALRAERARVEALEEEARKGSAACMAWDAQAEADCMAWDAQAEADRRLLERCREELALRAFGKSIIYRTLLRDLDARLGEKEGR